MIKQQSISRLATQISHPWFWKLKRDQAIRILESESLPQKGNFCVRPRKVIFFAEEPFLKFPDSCFLG